MSYCQQNKQSCSPFTNPWINTAKSEGAKVEEQNCPPPPQQKSSIAPMTKIKPYSDKVLFLAIWGRYWHNRLKFVATLVFRSLVSGSIEGEVKCTQVASEGDSWLYRYPQKDIKTITKPTVENSTIPNRRKRILKKPIVVFSTL